jgi:hypothetical protein
MIKRKFSAALFSLGLLLPGTIAARESLVEHAEDKGRMTARWYKFHRRGKSSGQFVKIECASVIL